MKLVKLSVYRPVAMSMVIFLLLLIGGVALQGLTVDLFPEIELPIAAITVNYPGIGPLEIENLVTAPLENIVGTVPNVEKINSISRLGGALIIVQFDWGTDMNFATLQLRERIELIRENLPREVPLPTVLKFDPRTLPIIQLAISSPTYPLEETKRIAESRIKPRLEPLNGVASIEVEGGAEREILLQFNHQKLKYYELTLQQIQQYLQAENMNLPAGQIHDKGFTIPLRVIGQFSSLQEIENLPFPTPKGKIITLGELASIEEALKSSSSVSYLNGIPSVGITIQKQTDANTVTVANLVNKEISKLRDELPADFTIEPIFDQSLYIRQSIQAVAINMSIGSFLAGIILFLFLRNVRATFIIALSIPLSLVTTFILMYFSKQTLNLLTLGGLALGIGMMVDNAIVILENIYRYRQNGYSIKESAIKGTSEVGLAVSASTLTTVIVFLPIVFVEGLAAQLFKPLALSVTYALLASLFTALIIVPLLTSRFMGQTQEESNFQLHFLKLQKKYAQLLKLALLNSKKVIIALLALFILSLACLPFIGTEFLPHQDQSIIYIDVRLTEGTSLETTKEINMELIKKIEEVPEIQNVFVKMGGVSQFQLAAGTLSNRANYQLQLVPRGDRNRADKEIADEIREKLGKIPAAKINISTGDSGFSGEPISLQIRGPHNEVLASLAHDVMNTISKIEGVKEPVSDFTSGSEEIQVKIDRLKAAQYGISTSQIALQIRQALEGLVASPLSKGGEELDLRLQLGDDYKSRLDYLKRMEVDSPLGVKVPLESLVEITQDNSPSSIKRTNRIREIAVTAQLLNRDLGSTIKEIRAELEKNILLPNGYSIHFGGQNEQMIDAFKKLAGALLLAVILVYMVMSAQFESFFFPFIIMLTVPFTMIGVVFGLLITFNPLGVASLVGLLILAGLVVNNAIVFVDYVNTLRKEGQSREEALITAGPVRLRPILMTALTTIIGLLPLMLGLGEGSEIQAPMATVIVFGLSFATLLTLFLVPILYKLLDEWREKRASHKAME